MVTSMAGLVNQIFQSFNVVITGLASGLKGAFENLIYVDPSATNPTMSPLVMFIFTMLGLGLATGVLWKIFSLVRNRG